MKKIIGMAVLIAGPFGANAQQNGVTIDNRIFNMCAIVFVITLFMVSMLTVIKLIMEYKLKNKIVERGIPENIASSIFQNTPTDSRNTSIKWFAMMAGIGAGLTIVNYTLPLGFHSLAIMAFSISLSFLGYYLFTKPKSL